MNQAKPQIPTNYPLPELTAEESERRRFARLLLGGALLAYTTPFVVAIWDFLTAPAFRRKAILPLMLGSKQEVFARQNYAVVKFGDKNAIILQTENAQTHLQATGARAFNLRCTHAGCTVEWQPAGRKFVCHCHGGEFAEDGSVTHLPPTRPLEELHLALEDGKLVLHDTAPASQPTSSSTATSTSSSP